MRAHPGKLLLVMKSQQGWNLDYLCAIGSEPEKPYPEFPDLHPDESISEARMMYNLATRESCENKIQIVLQSHNYNHVTKENYLRRSI